MSLQSLVHLSIIGEGGWDHGPLSLSHLTRLERVKLEVEDSAQHGHSSLPGSLQELELQSGMPNEWIDRFGLTSLTGTVAPLSIPSWQLCSHKLQRLPVCSLVSSANCCCCQ